MEERLTRLNAKSQSFDSTGASFGAMSVADLCAAFFGVSPIAEHIIRKRWIDDKDKSPGYYKLLRITIEKVEQSGHRKKARRRVQELLDIALDDYCKLFKCPQCDGKAQLILPTGQIHKCRSLRCHDGYVRRLDVDRAKLLGCKSIDYSRNYKPAMNVINDLLTRTLPEAESAGMSRIIKQSNWRD